MDSKQNVVNWDAFFLGPFLREVSLGNGQPQFFEKRLHAFKSNMNLVQQNKSIRKYLSGAIKLQEGNIEKYFVECNQVSGGIIVTLNYSEKSILITKDGLSWLTNR